MENEKINLAERYWVPKDSVEVSSGFFNPLDTKHEVTLLDTLKTDTPFVVLLGPPGIGKSTEFKTAHSRAIEIGNNAKFISLASIYTQNELENLIVNPTATDKYSFIYLDALDESPVSVPVIQSWIIQLAQSLKLNEEKSGRKTLVRISARTADWSEQFEKQLEEIWGKGSVQVFELPPLTKQQASSFIEKQVPNPAELLEFITQEDMSALASLPVTLRMLLNNFLTHGTLALGDKVTTYRRGILALLEESNQMRRASGSVGDLEVEARFVIAGRIAAASALSTKMLIWDGLYSDSVPNHAIPIHEIAGGSEQAYGNIINVSVKDIRETLRTGLFRQVEADLYEWVHKTFLEFLAAYYIKEHGTTTENILSLIRSHVPGNTHVVPQLREISAWLGTFDHNIWNELVVKEPGLLLSSDVALDSDKDRSVLVDKLLQKLDTLEVYDKTEWRQFYKRLKHKGLAAQLTPVIRDITKNNVVRRTAIDIAEACLQTELIVDLKDVAFDPRENDHIRSQATHALTVILPDNRLTELLPLAINPQGDADDEIKGWALTALWPQHISPEELFSTLTEPKNHSLIGSYSFFIYSLKVPELTPEEAIAGIAWLRAATLRDKQTGSFANFIPALLTEIWKCGESSHVLNELSGLVLDGIDFASRLRHEADLREFQTYYSNDAPNKRRALIRNIFNIAPENWSQARLLIFTPWQIVIQDDLSWLVDELFNESASHIENWLIELIISLIDWENYQELESLFNKSVNHLRLKQALDSASFINLDSEYAKWKQNQYQNQLIDAYKPAKPSRKQTILELLDKCEDKQPDVFWQLNLALLDTGTQIDEFTGVLAPSAGWDELSINERARVLGAAIRYLYEYRVDQDFLQHNTHHRPAAAGYRAFRLLLTEDSSSYTQIPSDIWASWALSILSFSTNDGETEREKQRQIAKDSFTQAPDAFIRAFSKYLNPIPLSCYRSR